MHKLTRLKGVANAFMLALGSVALVSSIIYASTILAFLGLGLTFWGVLFLYITPTKYVRLGLLNVTASSILTNFEKIIEGEELNGRAVYLPPKYLKDPGSSLIFIPSKPGRSPLESKESLVEEKPFKIMDGVLLSPIGLGLSRIIEKELKLGKPSSEIALNYLYEKLPRILEDMEIAERMEAGTEGSMINIEFSNHIFYVICGETSKLKTLSSMGCPLCSAVACILAKVTDKPVTIEREGKTPEANVTKAQYHIHEDWGQRKTLKA